MGRGGQNAMGRGVKMPWVQYILIIMGRGVIKFQNFQKIKIFKKVQNFQKSSKFQKCYNISKKISIKIKIEISKI